jgi:glycosyltransferase involved in cell wall biosynthesis
MQSDRPLRVALVTQFPMHRYFSERISIWTEHFSEHPTSWVVNLLPLLAARSDLEVHLVSLGSYLDGDFRFSDGGIHYHFLRGARIRYQLATFYRIDQRKIHAELGQIRPDVVEAFGTEAGFTYAGVTSKYPCIVYMLGIVNYLFNRVKISPASLQWLRFLVAQFAERDTVRRGKYFFVENEFAEQFVRSLNPKTSIYKIPNIINPIFFSLTTDLSTRCKRLLFVGAVSEKWKGAWNLLEAFFQLYTQFPDLELAMVGPYDQIFMERLYKQFGEQRLTKSIRLYGLKPPEFIANLMRDGAILIHPALMDSSPNSVLEAMVAGIPVVASRVGGIPYIVEEGVTGLLAEPGNSEELAKKITFLLEHPAEAKSLGENAARKMRQHLNHERIVEEIVTIYHHIVKDCSNRA